MISTGKSSQSALKWPRCSDGNTQGEQYRELYLFNSKETTEKLGVLVSSFYLCELTIFHSCFKFVPKKTKQKFETSQIIISPLLRTWVAKQSVYSFTIKLVTIHVNLKWILNFHKNNMKLAWREMPLNHFTSFFNAKDLL